MTKKVLDYKPHYIKSAINIWNIVSKEKSAKKLKTLKDEVGDLL